MDSTSLTSSASSSSGISASVLASIGDMLKNEGVDGKLFNFFLSSSANATMATNLAQNQASLSSQVQQAAAKCTANASSNSTASAASTSSTTSSSSASSSTNNTQDLASAWRALLDKLHERMNKQHSHAKAQAMATNNSDNSTGDNSDPTTTTTTASTSVSTTTTDGTTSTDASAPPSLTDILAELQKIAQAIEQKLQATQNASATTAQTADASLSTASIGNSNGLADMLALIRMTEKKLVAATLDTGSASSSDKATTQAAAAQIQTTTAASSTAPSITSTATTDLQNFLDAVQASLTVQSDINTAAVDSNSGAASAAATTSSASTQTTPDPALHGQDVKSLAAAVGNFLETVRNNISNASVSSSSTDLVGAVSAAASTSASAAVTGSANGSALDSGTKDNQSALTQGNNNVANLGTNATTENTKAATPYSFASQLSASRATTGSTGLPSAVEQVMLQLNKNVKTGNDQITIQLHPADLGSVKVKLDITSDGKVQGSVVASDPSTLNLLLKDVRSLERSLQEAGLSADPGSLQFSLGQQNGQSSNQASNGSSSGSNTTGGSVTSGALAELSVDTTETYYLTPTRVNMKV